MASRRSDVSRRSFHSSPAVVIQVRPGRRSDRWAWFYTRDAGMVHCVAPAARRPGRAWGGLLCPLTRGALTIKVSGSHPEWPYLVHFDDPWIPVAFRAVTPEYLVFLSYCADIAMLFLGEHETDAFLFDALARTAMLSVEKISLRGLAAGWTWTVLTRHGDISLEGDCPVCKRPIRAVDQPAIWDTAGNLYHATCRGDAGMRDDDYLLEPGTARVLRIFIGQPMPVDSGSLQLLAGDHGLFGYFEQRVKWICGREPASLVTARAIRDHDPVHKG